MSISLTKDEVEGMVKKVLSNSEPVKTLVKSLSDLGHQINAEYFRVLSCGSKIGGGFTLDSGIILCHNRLDTYTEVEQAMVHELIHCYDNFRVKYFDWSDCKQHACSEIRAASLSGDCNFSQELSRGNVSPNPLTWSDLHDRCVRRRAALSVAMNPACRGGSVGASVIVDSELQRCLADRSPFEAPPPS